MKISILMDVEILGVIKPITQDQKKEIESLDNVGMMIHEDISYPILDEDFLHMILGSVVEDDVVLITIDGKPYEFDINDIKKRYEPSPDYTGKGDTETEYFLRDRLECNESEYEINIDEPFDINDIEFVMYSLGHIDSRDVVGNVLYKGQQIDYIEAEGIYSNQITDIIKNPDYISS